MNRIKVGILGATGMVGQRYLSLLDKHPWFEVSFLAASPASSGKTYAEAVKGRWRMPNDIPDSISNIHLHNMDDISTARDSVSFVFSSLGGAVSKKYDEAYASVLPVISVSSAHRLSPDIPMLIPELNPDHVDIIPFQKENRNWDGFIVVKPTCTLQSYVVPLFALKDYEIKEVNIFAMQAISGAGHEGFSLDIEDNIIPFIEGEEIKSESEPLKIFGKIEKGKIKNKTGIKFSAHCNRVPVIDGHLVCVSASFGIKPNKEDIIDKWHNFHSLTHDLNLPSAPSQLINYEESKDRPQTRLDRDNKKGMAVTVGRLRECNILDWKFVGLSHNTIRGAAGGGILNAEFLLKKGYLG